MRHSLCIPDSLEICWRSRIATPTCSFSMWFERILALAMPLVC
jgi:hypothetical protein